MPRFAGRGSLDKGSPKHARAAVAEQTKSLGGIHFTTLTILFLTQALTERYGF
jgi:hypothetical protein